MIFNFNRYIPHIDLSASSPAARKIASLSSNLIHQVSRADPT